MSIFDKLIPGVQVAKKLYAAAEFGWKTGTFIDKHTGASDKLSNWGVKKFGPASPGLIDKVDKGINLYKRAVDLYKGTPNIGKVPVTQPKIYTRLATGFTNNNRQPSVSTLPKVPQMKLHPRPLGKSLPYNAYNNAKTLKTLTRTPAPKTWSPLTNKIFTIKTQQPQAIKFKAPLIRNTVINRPPSHHPIFTIKTQQAPKPFRAQTPKFTPMAAMIRNNVARTMFRPAARPISRPAFRR